MVMSSSMVPSAQQAQVAQSGWPAVGPVPDVVGVAPAGGHIAAGVGAVPIALVEGPPQRRWHHPTGGGGRDRSALAVAGDAGNGGIAGQAANGFDEMGPPSRSTTPVPSRRVWNGMVTDR